MDHAPKLYRELRELVNRGEPFSVTQQVRDYERERRTNSDGPLYQHVKTPLGAVRGGGLVRAQTLSRAFDGRRRALAVLFNALGSDTNDVQDRALAALLDAVERENTKTSEAVDALNSAAEFFAADNLEHLKDWAATVNVEAFQIAESRIGFPEQFYPREITWIAAPKPPQLPRPPALFE